MFSVVLNKIDTLLTHSVNFKYFEKKIICLEVRFYGKFDWLRNLDLNQGPSGYEPDELPNCSIPRYNIKRYIS